jgi:hypothetical protein
MELRKGMLVILPSSVFQFFFGELTGGISRKCGVHPKCVFEWEHDAGSGTWATRFSDLAQIEYCQRMMRI